MKRVKPSSTMRRNHSAGIMRAASILLLQGEADVDLAHLGDLGGDELRGFHTVVEAVDLDVGGDDDLVTVAQDVESGGHIVGLAVHGELTGNNDLADGTVIRDGGQVDGFGDLEGGRGELIGVEQFHADVDVALFLIGADVGHVDRDQTGGEGVGGDLDLTGDIRGGTGGGLLLTGQDLIEGETRGGGVRDGARHHVPAGVHVRSSRLCTLRVDAICLEAGAHDEGVD